MHLASVAARIDQGVQLDCEAWAITAHYWLDTLYVSRGFAL